MVLAEAAEVAELSEVAVEGEEEHQVPEARVQGAFLTEELTEVHAELKQGRRITTKRPFRNFVDVIKSKYIKYVQSSQSASST